MRKKNDQLREQLLACARETVAAAGTGGLCIRELAAKAGIASGTVYNYFQSKEEVLLALTEEYWRGALADMRKTVTAATFAGQVEQIFAFLRTRVDGSGGRLMDSLREVETAGRQRMAAVQEGLRAALVKRLEADAAIRPEVWTDTFTRQQYADFVLNNLLYLLEKKVDTIGFFLDILKRTLYEGEGV